MFLSCLEVLQRIEGCCDRAQIDSNIAHTVGLWSYATEKVTVPDADVGVVRGLCAWGGRAEGAVWRSVHGVTARAILVTSGRVWEQGCARWLPDC